MRKHILVIAFILVLTMSLIGLPLTALAADEVSFANDINVYLSGSAITVTAKGNSLVDSMVVYTTYVEFVLSANSVLVLRATGRNLLNNSAGQATNCAQSTYSEINFPVNTYGSATTVTVTPSASTCGVTTSDTSSGGGGGGGGGAAPSPTPTTPAVPSTSTGQVTATAAEGGKTTLTTDQKTTAQVELPANAVTASTEVNIYSKPKADIVSSRPAPSGKSVVGGYIYDYTATSGGKAVTTFSKNVTLTFTYTDTQISGLNEDTLKVYYWDGKQWTALSGTIDKVKNQITASTNHFTYFAVFGESGVTPATQMAKPEDYGLKEGDLIRATGDFDIFIINQYGYKRLFLNPVIFEMYGHLGSWDDVKTVTPATRDAFVTSSHYRYVNADKVYHLAVTGEDTGTLSWINMTGANFLAQGGKANAIFTINKSELDWYPKGADKTSL